MKFILFLVLSFVLQNAMAGYISLSSQVIPTASDQPGSIRFMIGVTNFGNDAAFKVAAQFPQIQKEFIISERLEPKARQQIEVVLKEADLQLTQQGSHLIFSRILYRDRNGYGFSSPQVSPYTQGTARSSAFRIRFQNLNRNVVELRGDEEIEFDVESTSEEEIKQMKISFVGPQEIEGELSQDEIQSLSPNSQQEIELEIENKTALMGSNYSVGILASGIIGDQKVSQYETFGLRIVGIEDHRRLWAYLMLAALSILAFFLSIRVSN